jgi:hypothetical protein
MPDDPQYDEDADYLDPDSVIEENVDFLNAAIRERGYDGIIEPNSNNIDGLEFVVFNPTQIKSATGNIGTFDPANLDIRLSRAASTQAAYEARIDALFAGESANSFGVKVLDKSDMLDILGFGAGPVHLVEGKVKAGAVNHPAMTADVWKKVPQ